MIYYDEDMAQEIINNNFLSTSKERVLWDSLNTLDKESILTRATSLINIQPLLGVAHNPVRHQAFPRLKNGKVYETPPYDLLVGALINELRKEAELTTEYGKLNAIGVKKYAVEGASIEFHESASQMNLRNPAFLYDDIKMMYFNDWIYI